MILSGDFDNKECEINTPCLVCRHKATDILIRENLKVYLCSKCKAMFEAGELTTGDLKYLHYRMRATTKEFGKKI
jgi:hypothetical protein